MIRESSPAMFVATAIISLGIGFGAATLIQRPRRADQPHRRCKRLGRNRAGCCHTGAGQLCLRRVRLETCRDP